MSTDAEEDGITPIDNLLKSIRSLTNTICGIIPGNDFCHRVTVDENKEGMLVDGIIVHSLLITEKSIAVYLFPSGMFEYPLSNKKPILYNSEAVLQIDGGK